MGDSSTSPTAEPKVPFDIESHVSEEATAGTSELIYIDPAKEAAAFRKFDKYVLPVSVVFLVLSSLDRNNVSEENTSQHPSC